MGHADRVPLPAPGGELVAGEYLGSHAWIIPHWTAPARGYNDAMHYHLTYRYDKRSGPAPRVPDRPSGRAFPSVRAALRDAGGFPLWIDGRRLARVCVGMCACPVGERELGR